MRAREARRVPGRLSRSAAALTASCSSRAWVSRSVTSARSSGSNDGRARRRPSSSRGPAGFSHGFAFKPTGARPLLSRPSPPSAVPSRPRASSPERERHARPLGAIRRATRRAFVAGAFLRAHAEQRRHLHPPAKATPARLRWPRRRPGGGVSAASASRLGRAVSRRFAVAVGGRERDGARPARRRGPSPPRRRRDGEDARCLILAGFARAAVAAVAASCSRRTPPPTRRATRTARARRRAAGGPHPRARPVGTCPFFVRISFGADDARHRAVSRGDGAFPAKVFFSVSKRARRRASGFSTTASSTVAASANSSTRSTQAPPTPASAPAGGDLRAPPGRDAGLASDRRARGHERARANVAARAARSASRGAARGAPRASAQRYSTTNAAAADGTRDSRARLSQTRDVGTHGGPRARRHKPLARAAPRQHKHANGASASLAADAVIERSKPESRGDTGAPPFAGRRATGRVGAVSRFPNAGFEAAAPERSFLSLPGVVLSTVVETARRARGLSGAGATGSEDAVLYASAGRGRGAGPSVASAPLARPLARAIRARQAGARRARDAHGLNRGHGGLAHGSGVQLVVAERRRVHGRVRRVLHRVLRRRPPERRERPERSVFVVQQRPRHLHSGAGEETRDGSGPGASSAQKSSSSDSAADARKGLGDARVVILRARRAVSVVHPPRLERSRPAAPTIAAASRSSVEIVRDVHLLVVRGGASRDEPGGGETGRRNQRVADAGGA